MSEGSEDSVPSIRVRNVEELNTSATPRNLPNWFNNSSNTSTEVTQVTITKVKIEPSTSSSPEKPSLKRSHSSDNISTQPVKVEKVEVKEEPVEDEPVSSTSDTQTNNKPRPRDCCKFGIKCYRRNAVHRAEEAHPGDADYRMPEYPEPPPDTPKCPYGTQCYRRNPSHFQQFSHTNSPQKKPTTQRAPPKRKPRKQRQADYSDDESIASDDSIMQFLNDGSSDDDEPFNTDEESDYDPGEDIED